MKLKFEDVMWGGHPDMPLNKTKSNIIASGNCMYFIQEWNEQNEKGIFNFNADPIFYVLQNKIKKATPYKC